MTKPSLLNTYEVFVSGEEHHSETIVAKSPSSARYQFWRKYSDCWKSYPECYNHFRARLIGKTKIEDYFTDPKIFADICRKRYIEFAYQGMVIDVAGKKGIIVGGNYSCNLDVLFEGKTFSENCHPTWETTYYDDKGEVIKDFKQPKN